MGKKTYIVVGIVIVAGAGFYFFKSPDFDISDIRSFVDPKESAEKTLNDVTALRGSVFTSSDERFFFGLSEGMTVSEVPDPGGLLVVVQDGNNEGVQIFSTSFDEPESVFTEERVRRDIPDLKMDSLRKVDVDGISALAFYSDNPAFNNDSYEVWFVKGGDLYQVSSARVQKEMVDTLISSWKFK